LHIPLCEGACEAVLSHFRLCPATFCVSFLPPNIPTGLFLSFFLYLLVCFSVSLFISPPRKRGSRCTVLLEMGWSRRTDVTIMMMMMMMMTSV
jgi:hypothetical protein